MNTGKCIDFLLLSVPVHLIIELNRGYRCIAAHMWFFVCLVSHRSHRKTRIRPNESYASAEARLRVHTLQYAKLHAVAELYLPPLIQHLRFETLFSQISPLIFPLESFSVRNEWNGMYVRIKFSSLECFWLWWAFNATVFSEHNIYLHNHAWFGVDKVSARTLRYT